MLKDIETVVLKITGTFIANMQYADEHWDNGMRKRVGNFLHPCTLFLKT